MKDIVRAALNSKDLLTVSQTIASRGVQHWLDARWIHLYRVGILDLDDGHWTLTTDEDIQIIDVDELAERITKALA